MAEWLSRLKRLFGFLKFGYEPEANTVVVTLRLNAYFVQGAVAAAFLLTLVFKYGGISFGSALQLVLDLSRSGLWFWVVVAAALALLVLAVKRRAGPGSRPEEPGAGSGIGRFVPQGARGTAVVCLVLLALLLLLMWGASGDTPVLPNAEAGGQRQQAPEVPGEPTPRVWREIQKGKRP
jgi:hypothetical protein